MPEKRNASDSQLHRVRHMTALYERLQEVIESEYHVAERLKALQHEIAELASYYDGGDWMEDYEAEQGDAFPKDMNRGILTEDTLYDLFCEIDAYTN